MHDKKTVCSGGQAVQYYRRECVDGQHVQSTVAALSACVERTGRRPGKYLELDNQAQFEKYLNLAAKGKLRPGDHVKSIKSDPTVDLFEIRWQNIVVQPEDPVSGLLQEKQDVQVRLYYMETGHSWVVGLHEHEKNILSSDQETRNAQNKEIQIAIDRWEEGQHKNWGVPELISDL